MDFGVLILRLVFGLTLTAHSVQKLFGWFGGPGIAGTAQMMEHLVFDHRGCKLWWRAW
jgi:putative oxidoreductase